MENQVEWQPESHAEEEDGHGNGETGESFDEHTAKGELVDFREPADGTIKSISLLGERNSGTRWIYG